jgi:hypothetical protein
MNDMELRIRVAELLGWTDIGFGSCSRHECVGDDTPQEALVGLPPEGTPGDYWTVVPNYPGDLNAMHEVEHLLHDDDWDGIGDYLAHLRSIMGIGCDEWRLPFATARQRAEAYVKVMEAST